MHDYPYPYINDSQNPNYIDETINEKQTPHFRFVVSIETTSRRADPRCIDKFKPRKNEQQYRISRVIGKHWSIIVWSSIEQTTIVRNEKRKKEKYRMILDTVLQWSIVSIVRTCYTHWTHSNEVCFSNGFSLPRPYTHKVHFPRMYLARLPFELRDGISSIYIYTYTRNKSLAPFMTFLHRSIDRLYRAPIYRVDVQNETSYTVVWWMILRGWKWKHSLWRRELVIQPFLREIKVTRQIFLPVTGWK